jgi:ABC-type lipoprotein export system ATPase subunit
MAYIAQPSQYAVKCVGVERSFGSGETTVRVLRGLDLTVEAGTLVALYGPSGSGKTTLLNLIGALDVPTGGSIEVLSSDIVNMSDGARATFRRTQLGFVFQSYALLSTYSALENIDLALRLLKLGYRERNRRAHVALEAVGLSAWASHVPDELSGGQRQRIAIARALALQPKLMLADEPTGGLDTRTTRRVMTLFRGIAHQQGTTFVIVSHDPLVAQHVDLAYDLHDGKLIPRVIENQLKAPTNKSESTGAAATAAVQEGAPQP